MNHENICHLSPGKKINLLDADDVDEIEKLTSAE